MKSHRNTKIGRKVVRATADTFSSKVKVIRPLNAVTERKSSISLEWDDYELQTWCTDGVQWPASPTYAVPQRSKVKVIMSHRQFDASLPITRQRKITEAPKLARRLSMPRLTFHTNSKVKRLKVKVIMAYYGSRTACYCELSLFWAMCTVFDERIAREAPPREWDKKNLLWTTLCADVTIRLSYTAINSVIL